MELTFHAAQLLLIVSWLLLASAAKKQFECTGSQAFVDRGHELIRSRCKFFTKVCVDQGVLRIHDEDLIRNDSFAVNM